MKIIYSRYHCTEIEPCESVAEGFETLSQIEDNGDGFSIGVYDEQAGTFYQTEQNVAGVNADQLLQKKLYTLNAHGIEPKKIKMFKPSPTPPDQ